MTRRPARKVKTVNATELAEILGVSESTIRRYAIRDGAVAGIPAIRIGNEYRGRWVFSLEAVNELLRPRSAG